MSKVLFLVLTFLTLTLQNYPQSVQCPQGHLPFGSSCKSIYYVDGCAVYQSDNTCKTCQFGYTLSQGRCLAAQGNETSDCCASYNKDGACVECAYGLFSSDPFCYKNQISGCILKQADKCVVCGHGLTLYKNLCIVLIADCLTYNQNGICIACIANQQLINNYCYPVPEITNCKSQNEYGCIECLVGYYLTSQRSCQQNQAGCITYWQEKCQACLPKFMLKQNKCLIWACKTYGQDSCAQCLQPYSLKNGICQVNGCIAMVNNACIQCRDGLRLTQNGCVEPINYKCNSCAQGFKFVNGNCVKVIFGCLSYKNNNQCAQCDKPFQLTINGDCQILGCKTYCKLGCHECNKPFTLQNNVCVISNCIKYSSNSCTTCQDGYLLINGICFQKDPNCISYAMTSERPICTQCVDRYYPLQGECKPAQKGCVYDSQGNCRCRPEFYTKAPGQCEIIGCAGYNWQTCLSCFSPFEYSQQTKTCKISSCTRYSTQGCAECDKGWLLQNGVCLKGDPYCISYNGQGICQACDKGFVLSSSSSKCIKNIPNCSRFSNDFLSCIECESGYTLSNSLCKKVIANCKEMNFDKEICSSCIQGFHLVNGACVIDDENCATYAKQSNQPTTEVCTSCRDNYYYQANQNVCRPKLPGCVYTASTCTTCFQPFIFDSQNKICFISGCEKYTLRGCQTCAAPFALVNGNCLIERCSVYSKQACVKCENGFTISNQGLCVAINPNCLTHKGTQCIKCKDGFTLVNGFCVIQDVNCINYGQNGVICTVCNPNYHPDLYGRCQINQPGCLYQKGQCTSCSAPFSYDYGDRTCGISNCAQADAQGCVKCKNPFKLTEARTCTVDFCIRWDSNGCAQCRPQYHTNNGACVADSPNCQYYSPQGYCELCRDKYVLSSNGQCIQGGVACTSYCEQDKTKCLVCSQGYFLNRFFQCQRRDGRCEAYTNGVCSKCSDKYFLYSDICFPYTQGCVQYSGKDCTQCKTNYVLKNEECFKWKPQGMALMGGDDHYDFEINPIDVRQSKYYINNLSPATAIGKYYFSSFQDNYQDWSLSTFEEAPSKGWKAKVSDKNQYIGVALTDQPATFYALQLESVEGSYITQFYLEYSVDGTSFIRVQTPFTVPASVANNLTTIYFTGIYAKSIRISITGFWSWPACRVEFFYYDLLRFRKISNLKSLTYLQETINSNFVDRVDNQIFINQIYFFNPTAQCSVKEMCFTGLQLCESRVITGLTLTFDNAQNYVTEFYLTYSIDGRSYNCYNNCLTIKIDKCLNNSYSMKFVDFKAQGVRVYPKNYKGSPKFSPTFFYS